MSTQPPGAIPSNLSLDSEGFAVVPAGCLATVETSLERTTPPKPESYPLPTGFKLVHPNPVDLEDFKSLFRAVGDPWLWFGRLTKSDEDILSILTTPMTTLRYLVHPSDGLVGLFEAQQQQSETGNNDTLEVTYFGLVPEATGKGLGPSLMEHGLAEAWSPSITSIWLHTCTFDSPAALSFYRRQGFRAFKQRLEIGPDPRLTGTLPRHVAPHIPLGDFSDP
ncbi:MAG: GNAT family N-acetyltransferase [Pseudomonadota bacterium]